MKKHYNDCEIYQLVMFYNCELQKEIVRDDYRALIELSIIYFGGDKEKKLKIRPPGAMHQARWMARTIYSLKICLYVMFPSPGVDINMFPSTGLDVVCQ